MSEAALLESGADLGLSLLSLRSSSLLVDRSLIRADGGSGFLRLGSFEAVKGEVKNSEVFISWNGPGVLFERSGGGPAFRFDTVVAGTAKGGLRFFDSRGTPPQVWNSILECSGQGSELLRSDTAPGSGVLVADCVWGFDKVLAGAATPAISAPSTASMPARPSILPSPSCRTSGTQLRRAYEEPGLPASRFGLRQRGPAPRRRLRSGFQRTPSPRPSRSRKIRARYRRG